MAAPAIVRAGEPGGGAAAADNGGRTSDVTIFGATGFTGQFVVAEALRALPATTRLAIAGRSRAKLEQLAARLGASDRLQVLVADISAPDSLQAMARGTRLLLNCVGPYRLYGEAVFSAAAAAGTDYLDLAGEPEYIERMELRYGRLAASTCALMACASGFDSIPADVGTLAAAAAFTPPSVASAVEAVIQVEAPLGTRVHYATWEAAVRGVGSVAALRALRREAAAAGLNPKPKLVGPRPLSAEGPVWDPRVGAYTLPFPGADAAVVRRTQSAVSAAGEPAVHFSARFAVPGGLAGLVQFIVFGGLMMALAKWGWGRALLLRYPGLFSRGLVSHEGPTQAQMEATRTRFTLFATGFSCPPRAGASAGSPDKKLTARVSFGDPGYLATSAMMVAAAATLLQERPTLVATAAATGSGSSSGTAAPAAAAAAGGGVFTVGALFRRSGLVQRLEAAGVSFSVTEGWGEHQGTGQQQQ